MQALILAGGQGTRLRARLNGLPKPMVDVDGIPLLQRQVEALRDQGITSIVVLVNYQAEVIRQFCAAHADFGTDLTIVDDGEPLGTSGAVMAIRPLLHERFLVVYGDTLMDVDFTRLLAAHADAVADATIFLHPNDHPMDSDLVALDEDGWVTEFRKYPHPPGALYRNLVNAALYVMERGALAVMDGHAPPHDFGKDVFPAMLRAGRRIRGYVSPEYIKDIGTPDRLDRAVGHLRSGRVARARLSVPQRTVFLDRDGTLNVEVNHLRRPDQLELLPGAGAAIRRLNAAEFRCVVVTNQPVLARGDCTAATMAEIHGRLDQLLGADHAFLDAIYLCPHHPDAGFPGEVPALKRACDCRKPGTGLIEQAEAAMPVDRAQSWLVGDTTSDIETARRAGLRSILVRTGHAGQDGKHAVTPDFDVPDLAAAVDVILRLSPPFESEMQPP